LSTSASEQVVQHRSPAVGEWTLRGATGLLTAYAPVATLVILVLAVAAGNSNSLSVANLLNMFSQWAPAGIIAAGMTYVVLTGGFDLSVAAAYSFTAVVAAVVGRSFDPAIAFASAVAAGVCFGIINGSLIAVVKLNPFITTVGTGFMLNGLALLLTDNAAISVDNSDFGWLGAAKTFGIPDSGILLIGTYALLETILRRTTYGEAVYAVGGNYEASWLSGLPVRFVIASTYVPFGACCGLAASITASQRGGRDLPRRRLRIGLAHGNRPWNYRNDVQRVRTARHQSLLPRHYKGNDYCRCASDVRHASALQITDGPRTVRRTYRSDVHQ
jgi:ribose/xylose/arabinose/galactoside ABC-type transport system permease subunit